MQQAAQLVRVATTSMLLYVAPHPQVPRIRFDPIHKRLLEDNSRPATLQPTGDVSHDAAAGSQHTINKLCLAALVLCGYTPHARQAAAESSSIHQCWWSPICSPVPSVHHPIATC